MLGSQRDEEDIYALLDGLDETDAALAAGVVLILFSHGAYSPRPTPAATRQAT